MNGAASSLIINKVGVWLFMPYINGMVISRDLLKSLVNQGKSQRAIAAQLDISQTSVRRYLDLYNLKTTK